MLTNQVSACHWLREYIHPLVNSGRKPEPLDYLTLAAFDIKVTEIEIPGVAVDRSNRLLGQIANARLRWSLQGNV